jgi:hypothetical protein
MYKQIQGTYDIEDTPRTNEAKQRIEQVMSAMAELTPKLDLLATGNEVEFTVAEQEKWDMLTASYSSGPNAFEQAIISASRD